MRFQSKTNKGGLNIAEFANIIENFWQKTFGDIGFLY
jgi:hypothetical protein